MRLSQIIYPCGLKATRANYFVIIHSSQVFILYVNRLHSLIALQEIYKTKRIKTQIIWLVQWRCSRNLLEHYHIRLIEELRYMDEASSKMHFLNIWTNLFSWSNVPKSLFERSWHTMTGSQLKMNNNYNHLKSHNLNLFVAFKGK